MREKLPSVSVQLTLVEIGYLHANLDHQIQHTRQLLVRMGEVRCNADADRVVVLNQHADRLEALKMRIEAETLGKYPDLIGRAFE